MSDTVYYQQDTATSTDQIISLFRETFTHSEGAEEGDLIASLVEDLMLRTEASDRWIFSAWEGDLLIGCIFFSKFWFDQSDKSAMMLSPVAILPRFQGRGVGQGLIRFAHDQLRDKGLELVITYGDPRFYSKVGYQLTSESIIPAPHVLEFPEGWLAQKLDGSELTPIPGNAHCIACFNRPGLW